MQETRQISISLGTWHRLKALARSLDGPDRSVPELLDLWVRSIDPETEEVTGLWRCPECSACTSIPSECWRCGVDVDLEADPGD